MVHREEFITQIVKKKKNLTTVVLPVKGQMLYLVLPFGL